MELQEPTEKVRQYIDEALRATVHELSSPDGRPSITIRRRTHKHSTFFINPDTQALEATESNTQVIYSWPGKDVYEAWKFTVTMRVLAAIAEAVHTGIVMSKRDIYYSDPTLFNSQKTVDTIVDNFAYTIGVDRAVLNVVHSYQAIANQLQLQDSVNVIEILDGEASPNDTLVPSMQNIREVDTSKADWILIVEKEAVYRRLAGNGYHTGSAAGKGIILTGKGYPDLNTRAFVHAICNSSMGLHKTPRVYALVDSDPDGMAIMATYKYGSMAHASENARLNAPQIRWLGLRTSDVVAGADPVGDDVFMRLTARDRKKALAMLSNNPVWAIEGPEREWRAELQQMLMLNLKAEIETLYNQEGGIERWIDQRMTSGP